jgi:hypothetical protein
MIDATPSFAAAWSYVDEVDAGLLDEIERIIATLIRLII